MRIRFVFWSLLVLPMLLAAPAGAAPEVGDRAPDFRFVGEGGRVVRFDDYFGASSGFDDPGGDAGASGETAGKGGGRRGVVIAWFPKAFTPG